MVSGSHEVRSGKIETGGEMYTPLLVHCDRDPDETALSVDYTAPNLTV